MCCSSCFSIIDYDSRFYYALPSSFFSFKASMIWIIGEYAERIDNADELLESFLESFPEEPAQVQLQLLTATVKLFLKKPTEGPQQMIQVFLYTYMIVLQQVMLCLLFPLL